MTSQFMELFEMQQSYREEKEDSNIEKNIFIRKIFLFTFTEYFVTFLASFVLEFAYYPIVFYCFLPLSLGFQIYFEFQGEIRNEKTRTILNYTFGSLSIISNYFSNFYIWNVLCYGDLAFYYGFAAGKILQLVQILLVLFIFMFYSNISKTNFNNKIIWLLPIIIPFFLLFIYNFFYFYQGDPLFQTVIITWFLIMMIMMTKEMKQTFNSYDEIFVHSCRLLGVPFQILVYILKFIMTSHYSEDYLYQASSKEKVAYLRKVAVTFFTITFCLIIFQTQALLCSFETDEQDELEYTNFCNSLIDVSVSQFGFFTLSFKALYWISLGISLITYLCILIGHQYFCHWIINWIKLLIQVVFFSFSIFGAAWYELFYYSQYESYYQIYGDFSIYQTSYCSLCGISIGLLIYTFNMGDNLYNKFNAINLMMICPICIWITQIYILATLDAIYIAYQFGVLIGYLVYAFLIAQELEWQLRDKNFELKQYDYYIGAIQIFEPGFSIFSRLFTQFM